MLGRFMPASSVKRPDWMLDGLKLHMDWELVNGVIVYSSLQTNLAATYYETPSNTFTPVAPKFENTTRGKATKFITADSMFYQFTTRVWPQSEWAVSVVLTIDTLGTGALFESAAAGESLGTNYQDIRVRTNGAIYCFTESGSGVNATTTGSAGYFLADGVPHHYYMYGTATTLYIYRDGTFFESLSYTPCEQGPNVFTVGNTYTGGNGFEGLMGKFYVWDLNSKTPHTADQIKYLANEHLTNVAGWATVVNGDFETGDMTGWTTTTGSWVADATGYMVYEGTYGAWAGNNSLSTMYQEVAVPAWLYDAIDDSNVHVWALVDYYGRSDGTTNDGIVGYVETLNSSLGTLDTSSATRYHRVSKWSNLQCGIRMSTGTRHIRTWITSYRYAGTSNDGHPENIRVKFVYRYRP